MLSYAPIRKDLYYDAFVAYMGRKKRKTVVKYKPKPENVRIFEEALKSFPNCVGTYPDCPEEVDVTQDPCMHCPIYLESPKKKFYLKKMEKIKAKKEES
jgi:hypothetical protein